MPPLLAACIAIVAASPESPQRSPQPPATVVTTSAAGLDESTSRDPATADAQPDGSSANLPPLRSGRELHLALREALPRLASPENDRLEAVAEELLFLYQEVRHDTEMAEARREYYQGKLKFRLRAVSDQIVKRIARNQETREQADPETLRTGPQPGEQLGQRIGRPPAGPALPPGRALPPRPAVPNDDYGQQLVDLIQKTIAPSSWDVNGGLGTIYYWRPGRALVVRQTDAVHEEVGGVLRQLERAGR